MLDQAQRDELVVSHLSLARYHALRLAPRSHPDPLLGYDDLLAWGVLGLVEAAQTYDPSQGFKFITWAGYRVRRRIFDALRQVHDPRNDGETPAVYSLDWSGDPEVTALCERLPDPAAEFEGAVVDALTVAEAFGKLSEADRQVLWQLDVQGESQRQVAAAWGLSSSAIDQRHRRALDHLRQRLGLGPRMDWARWQLYVRRQRGQGSGAFGRAPGAGNSRITTAARTGVGCRAG